MAADFPAIRPESVTGARLYADRLQMVRSLGIPHFGAIAEVGVAHGDFTDFLLRELEPAHFYAIDLFEMEKVPVHWGIKQEVLFQGKTHYDFYCNRFNNLGARISILRGDSTARIADLPDASLDMIYIDANHSYEFVSKEAALSASKIKPDGTLIFNDYIAYDPFAKCEYGVIQAVNEIIDSGWRVTGFALEKNMFCDIAIRRASI